MSRLQANQNAVRVARDRSRRNRPFRNRTPRAVVSGAGTYSVSLSPETPGGVELDIVYSGTETGVLFQAAGYTLTLTSSVIAMTNGAATITASIAKIPRGSVVTIAGAWRNGRMTIWRNGVVIAEGDG